MTMGSHRNKKPSVPLKSKLKKDPGVPRLPDLKVRQAEKEKQKQRVQSGGPPRSAETDAEMASEPTLASLAAQAEAASSQLPPADNTAMEPDAGAKTKEQIRRHYIRTLHKVIDQSDIVLLVLDARDPEGCRSRLVEEEVRRREGEGKRLVFVLNKIDLIPKDNAVLWLRHLRHSTPTLPFRSASSNQRSNLSTSTAAPLMRLLKAYKPSTAQSATVGVVGFPNVGKSSLINSLKRSKACAVAAQPGHTKDLQSVALERGLRIVDSPGVVFDEDDDAVDAKTRVRGSVLLRNVVRVEDVEDPIAVVEEILARTDKETIQSLYKLPAFGDPLEFLTMLALTSGKLLKGGTPDLLAAARHVITDWNHQRIPYFSVPPTVHPSSIPSTLPGHGTVAPGAERVGEAQIVTSLGKAFTLEGLFGAADAGAFGERDAEMEDADAGGRAVEDEMDEDVNPDGPLSNEMDAEVAPLHLPQKRSRSRSSTPTASQVHARPAPEADLPTRAPKRMRRNKDVATHNAPAAPHNTHSTRASQKKERKRARRAAARAEEAGGGGGMEVDDEGALEFTFIA